MAEETAVQDVSASPEDAGEVVWSGNESLRQFLVPIHSLRDNPANPRRGDTRELAMSLLRFGQTKPVTTEQDGETIVAGHHVRRAAQELAWTHIAAIPHEFKDSIEAKAYLLADNQLGQLGDFDVDMQLSALDELAANGALDGTGFDLDSYEDLRARQGAIPEVETNWQGGYAESPEEAAARAEAFSNATAMKEIVLLVDQEQAEAFGRSVRILMKWHNTTGVVATVLKVIEHAAYLAEKDGSGPSDA